MPFLNSKPPIISPFKRIKAKLFTMSTQSLKSSGFLLPLDLISFLFPLPHFSANAMILLLSLKPTKLNLALESFSLLFSLWSLSCDVCKTPSFIAFRYLLKSHYLNKSSLRFFFLNTSPSSFLGPLTEPSALISSVVLINNLDTI